MKVVDKLPQNKRARKNCILNPTVLKLAGLKFGQLTAIKPTAKRVGRAVVWECLCDCGNTTYVISYNLYRESTKSCGCIGKKLIKEIGHKNSKDTNYGPAFNRLYGYYYKNAFARKLDFTLSKEMFQEITSKNCHYCGVQPEQAAKSADKKDVYIYNGIDRINNNTGYATDNIVPCCGICNKAKSSMTIEIFTTWLNRLVTFQNNLK